MRRKSVKQTEGEASQQRVKAQTPDDDEADDYARGNKKHIDQYKCGKAECGKLYHSYTAFYNHCKKSHDGIFPANSIYNGKIFEGPSKNRGRPRIKKTDAKDSVQIQSLKTQNQLIQFLGTVPKKKKSQQLIVYVANPVQQLGNAISEIKAYKKDNNFIGVDKFLDELVQLNIFISQNDLPDFYDPIEIELYSDKVDSYNFLSIYNFITQERKIPKYDGLEKNELLMKIMIIWLTRILSVPLLAEVVYTIGQMHKNVEQIAEKEYMYGRGAKFRQLVEKYLQCIKNEQGIFKASSEQRESQA